MTASTVEIPGYTTGTWAIDPVHSDVSFTVRHLGVSKVRGIFEIFSGQIVLADNVTDSTVTAEIDLSSLNTKNDQRDGHVRSEDFLHVDNHPTMSFRSTDVRVEDGELKVHGDLTVRGVTKPITLDVEINGFAEGPDGTPVVGLSATGTIDRTEFGVGGTNPMVANKILLSLEIEAAKQS